jgi:hypothetical protein
MPEPSDPLSLRLAAAPGLASLLDEANATWMARADRDAEPDRTRAGTGAAATRDAECPDAPSMPASDEPARAEPALSIRPSTPRWRAFEDAFPTFYQFTNRPRG